MDLKQEPLPPLDDLKARLSTKLEQQLKDIQDVRELNKQLESRIVMDLAQSMDPPKHDLPSEKLLHDYKS